MVILFQRQRHLSNGKKQVIINNLRGVTTTMTRQMELNMENSTTGMR